MSIDRRAFLSSAGVGLPLFSLASEAAAATRLDIDTGSQADMTPSINSALQQSPEVYLPNGQIRIDGTVDVPAHTRLVLAHGTLLKRLAKESDSKAPVVRLLGNRASLSGGRIATENDHPNGIVTLGHADRTTKTRYNATQWHFSDCWLEGVQRSGNVGIWIPNAQAEHLSAKYANYFGYVQNIAIRGADIGVLLDEVANAHRFFGVSFSHLISSAWDLRGAYGNQVIGGFLHQSSNGIVAIRLRNTNNEKYHDSVYNSFLGFGIEPGGGRSSAYHIDTKCRRNTLILQSNVAGASVDKNGENFISRHGGDWSVDPPR